MVRQSLAETRRPHLFNLAPSTVVACCAGAIALISSSVACGEQPIPLSEQAYKALGSTQGIVMLQVNWGRKWKCGIFENAQLESLTFARSSAERIAAGPSTLELTTPSKLLVNDSFTAYALLITPGKYVLTGYDVKVARSTTEVGHLRGDETQLIRNGEPIGGTFSVEPGEIVYIGHVSLDCASEPMPWRYYIETSQDFDRYVAGFRKTFPFVRNAKVTYRLLTTKLFGQDHSLESTPGPSR